MSRSAQMIGQTVGNRLIGLAFAATLVAGTIVLSAPFAADARADDPSPLIVQGGALVQPVEAADGRVHLIYELLLVNQGMTAVTIDSVAVLDGTDHPLQTIRRDELAVLSRLSPLGGDGTQLQPSESGVIFMDVILPGGAAAPDQVRHAFTATLSVPEMGGAASFGGLTVEGKDEQRPVTFHAADIAVDLSPVAVLSPPVRGSNWVVFRGCCDLLSSHRGTTSFPGGVMQIAERFAIDFVQTNEGGMMMTGPGNELASYVHYGAEILAVADGTVVSARNTEPDQMPGAFPPDLDDDLAGGNAVVLDIGEGRYAFYGHMQPGSVTVKAGDAVKAGDVIGLLGNSGRTIGPHLHFHVMDNADWRLGNGVPYRLRQLHRAGCPRRWCLDDGPPRAGSRH